MRKKSPNVSRFIEYNFLAKKKPKRKRHSAAPNGSSITLYKPPFKNSDDAPKTVSDPNHVANKAAELNRSGKLLPANIKSPVVFTRREAHIPTITVRTRYSMIKPNSKNLIGF